MNDWIAVKDRLPEKGSQVLACWSEWDCYDHLAFDGHNWWNCNSSNESTAPSHWMPLPELPKPEDET